MSNENLFADLADKVASDNGISEVDKNIIFSNLAKLKETKIHILVVGATGCGKSSTINALFNTNRAKVGQGVNPETMEIEKYEMNNINIYDSPGLGDGKDADIRHSKNITDLLLKLDSEGKLLVDLVLVLLDGGSRDLGTSFELINRVIIPSLGEDKSRLLVAINQADMAMKGRYWDYGQNKPEKQLIDFLNEKVISTKARIKEATGVTVDVIYYAAGYKEGSAEQRPYNLSKLFAFILRHTKKEKRIVFATDVNSKKEMWQDDDGLEDYRKESKESMWESVKDGASKGASTGAALGEAIFGPKGAIIGGAIGGAIGAVAGFFSSLW
jgi:uncharacterized protein